MLNENKKAVSTSGCSPRIVDALSGRPRLGRREGDCWVKDWEEPDVPAHCRTEGKGAGPSTFA